MKQLGSRSAGRGNLKLRADKRLLQLLVSQGLLLVHSYRAVDSLGNHLLGLYRCLWGCNCGLLLVIVNLTMLCLLNRNLCGSLPDHLRMVVIDRLLWLPVGDPLMRHALCRNLVEGHLRLRVAVGRLAWCLVVNHLLLMRGPTWLALH